MIFVIIINNNNNNNNNNNVLFKDDLILLLYLGEKSKIVYKNAVITVFHLLLPLNKLNLMEITL